MTKKQCGFGNWRPAGCKKLTAESSSKKAAVRKQFVMDVIQQTALRVRNGLIGAAMVGLAYFGGGLGDHHYLRSLHPVAIGTDVCDRRKQTYAIISGSAIRGIGLMLRSGTLRGAERLRVSTSVH